MTENSSQPILNPNIYLNYLHPTSARDYEAARNIFLVTFGALSWDILSSLPTDWKLARTTKPSPVLFAYFLSRTCALAVVLMSVLTTTGPVHNCSVMQLIICIFWVLAPASSSYLFLKRVHAVYLEQRLVCHAFTIFWIATVGATTVLVPATLHSYYQIANTKHCINGEINKYAAVAFFVPAAFDDLVYAAITHKILKSHRNPTEQTNWRSRCFNKSLPRLSKAVLQGGQQYYMVTVGFNFTRANIVLQPTSSPVLQLLFLVPSVAITSVMACRVFRNLKLEALRKIEIENLTTIRYLDKAHGNTNLPRTTVVTEVDLERADSASD